MNTSAPLELVRKAVHRQIIGQEKLIDRLLIALLCNGHVLLEGAPGLAKTKLVKALTAACGGKMERVQFTPDLLPSDVIGTEIFRPEKGEFVLRTGPVFTNFLLGDEINRAPAKVQSALLQAMEERTVTIGQHTHHLPEPFFVLATQNPLEQEGTYPLPEAQLDRFLMKLDVNYPSYEEELSIVRQYGSSEADMIINPVTNLEEIQSMQKTAGSLYVDERLDRFIVSLVQRTREPEKISGFIQGASPRASIALRKLAKAHAFLQGRTFVGPDDIKEVYLDVMRHRVVPSYANESQGRSANTILSEQLSATQIP
jgi:MoxR-like ATPase